MTFLTLTPLQALLLAALTAGAVIALYLLKMRFRRVLVPSSLLWLRVLHEQRRRSLWERLRKMISILLAVTIALLIALAPGRPQTDQVAASHGRIEIVLDTSPTMAAFTRDGSTRWQRAVKQAMALIGSGSPDMLYRISDTSGRIAGPFTSDRNELYKLVRQAEPAYIEPRFPHVEEGKSEVYVISDGVSLPGLNEEIVPVSVLEPAPNTGITAFAIRSAPATPLKYDAYLEVKNFGENSAEVVIRISGRGGETISRTAQLAAGEVLSDVFDISNFPGGEVRADIQTAGDALEADNAAFAYLPSRRKTRVLLVTPGNNYLETLLKLDPRVFLRVVPPSGFRESSDFDVNVFDRFVPSTQPSRPSLLIGASAAPWLGAPAGTVFHPVITARLEGHPLLRNLSLHDIAISRAARIAAGNSTVIAACEQTPLILAGDSPKWVLLGFDLGASDFPLSPAFPIFIQNVLDWFGRDQPSLMRHPGLVEVPLAGARINKMSGEAVAAEQQNQSTFFEASKPGLYAAVREETRLYVAVNFQSRKFSDLNRSRFRHYSGPSRPQSSPRREPWFYMLLTAAVLIVVEWFTYHKGITL